MKDAGYPSKILMRLKVAGATAHAHGISGITLVVGGILKDEFKVGCWGKGSVAFSLKVEAGPEAHWVKKGGESVGETTAACKNARNIFLFS